MVSGHGQLDVVVIVEQLTSELDGFVDDDIDVAPELNGFVDVDVEPLPSVLGRSAVDVVVEPYA